MAFDKDDEELVKHSLMKEDADMFANIARIDPSSAKSARDLMPRGFRLNERNEIEIVSTERNIASRHSDGSSKVDFTDTLREEETRRILSSLGRVERDPFD